MKATILQHHVYWFVDSKSVKELDETSIEHIENAIKDGCNQGSLNIYYGKKKDKETSGWWSIVGWQDIACELYNALLDSGTNPSSDRKKKACKRFNDNWA